MLPVIALFEWLMFLTSQARTAMGICHMEFDSLTSKFGNFTSPQYPEPYPASIHCYYLFKGQESETLKITFLHFDLEPPFSKGCLNDFVDISTISVSNVRQLVGRYCGVDVPVPLLTMKPRMEIIFKTNHAHERTGFFGMYQFTDESFIHPPQSTRNISGCGGTLTGVGGNLVSPGYPESFPKDVDCNWLIRVDYDKHIYIRILELQLKGSIANCGEAELAIFDGYSNLKVNPVQLKRYCGDLKYYKNTEEKTQLSKRNRILVRLRTTVNSPIQQPGQIIGFKLVWTAVTFQPNDVCKEYTCPRSQYCMNSESRSCTETRQYCIDRSLVCDGLPNCSDEDFSDEDKCNLPLLAGCGAGAGVVLLCALMAVILCRRHSRRAGQAAQGLALPLRQLEHSPTCATRQTPFLPELNCSLHRPQHLPGPVPPARPPPFAKPRRSPTDV
ncbi:neuropilin and tolloid-like protein 2 [Haemaphysalis longicornis]